MDAADQELAVHRTPTDQPLLQLELAVNTLRALHGQSLRVISSVAGGAASAAYDGAHVATGTVPKISQATQP
jgi:hypothetical protein